MQLQTQCEKLRMTDLLEQAIARANQLDNAQQDVLATMI
jgi:hypothetical protein